MRQDEAGEWGESFDEAALPRRDRVPPTGFTLPKDYNSNPELAFFVPPFRMKRRRVAARLTVAFLAVIALLVIRLAMWTARVGATPERPLGVVAYFFVLGCMVAGFLGLRKTWRWANAPDPADVRNPLLRGVPPLA